MTANAADKASTLTALTQMTAFLNQWVVDVSTMGYRVWNRGYERWQYIWAGYWLNFVMTVLILFALFFVLCILNGFVYKKGYSYNVKMLKTIMVVVGFFVVMYGVMLIIFVAG